MIQVEEDLWAQINKAVTAWRERYDRLRPNQAPQPKDGADVPLLYALSSRLGPARFLAPSPEMSAGEEPAQAMRRMAYETDRLYTDGDNHGRAISEFRAGRRVQAAAFMEYDLNGTGRLPPAQFDAPLRVDPASIREEDGKLVYRLVKSPPEPPKTFEQAMQFFRKFSCREDFVFGITAMDTAYTTLQVRIAAEIACQKGYTLQANYAALLCAAHFGIPATDVNPFPDTVNSPWMDELDGIAKGRQPCNHDHADADGRCRECGAPLFDVEDSQ